MKVLITDNAYKDIKNFADNSKATDKTINSYITSLLTFTLDLSNSPEMGKYSFDIKMKSKKYTIRHLIYKQHKILYYIDNAIHVIGIVHTKQDVNQYIKELKKFIDFN